MYTENNNGGLLKNIILKLLFIALFIFLLLWLYPRPNTKPFYDSIFNDNIMMMKEVAEDYYTVQRLPKEVGEKDKLTLRQMLDKKLLLPFVDKNGEYCDYEKSYVQVTKLENDEYELKVNLSCKGQTDYIIVYLGCHDLCVDGKCETVVSTIEYKFTRELVKGRKPVKVDLFKYEYSKQEKEAYTVDKNVTYYKGRKKASEDVYKFEYTKPEKEAYDVNVTYYKGKKKISDDVYKYEYTKPVTIPYTVSTTYYKGKKQVSANVYTFEYVRYVSVAPTCKSYYNQSSVPSGATNVTSNTHTVTVPDGYTYGQWVTANRFTSPTPIQLTATDTERILSDGYTTSTGLCTSSSCPEAKILYKYIRETRTKTQKTKTMKVTTYNYQICTPNPAKPEYKWSVTDLGQGWTKTGKKDLVSTEKYDETGWLTYDQWLVKLSQGYKLLDTNTDTRTEYRTELKRDWSTKDLTKEGWTKTGAKELVESAKYDETGWVTKLPAGYTQTAKETRKEVRYKDILRRQWSTEDLTSQGWTKTGKNELVSKGSYIYTDWVTKLPAGYEQTAKETRTEKEVKYRTITKTDWSTEDLTSQGWTKTGNKKKIGQTTKYEYTGWVTKLPAGYEQIDKTTEVKWSTDKKLPGWTLTKDTRVKEDK